MIARRVLVPMHRRGFRRLAAVAVIFLLAAGECPACPSCRDALAVSPAVAGQPSPAAVSRGFNLSILAMAMMPFLLMGATVWSVASQGREEKEQWEQPRSPAQPSGQ